MKTCFSYLYGDGLGSGGRAVRPHFIIWGDPPQVGEAEQREDEHDRGADEGADRGDPGDHAHSAEGVGVEQQAAQGLTLEHRLDRSCQLGVCGGALALALS